MKYLTDIANSTVLLFLMYDAFSTMLYISTWQIPQASTCFNMLKLSDYSSEQELRNKVLIAVRYGCEGFAFS